MQHVEGRLAGVGSVGLYWQGWLPATAPRGLLLVCHGMGEHSGRYGPVVGELVPDGWAVYALDHRGHGRSRGPRVHVRRYADYLADLDAFRRRVAARHPDLRPFLLGHSMGGQIALAYALDHSGDLAGLVLSAPPLQPRTVPRVKRAGYALVARVAPRLRRAVVDLSKISQNPAVVAAYDADPLVHHGDPTITLSLALAAQMTALQARAAQLRLPLLVQHGTADVICAPSGSRELAAAAGSADVTTRWYEGLWHEIYQEPEHAPLADLREWLDARR